MKNKKTAAKKALTLLIYLAMACFTAWLFVYKQSLNNLEKDQNAPVKSTVRLLSGKERSISDFLNKPLVLNFWSTWCTTCLQELPSLQELAKIYSQKVNFLGVCLDCEKSALENVIKTNMLTYQMAIGDLSLANAWKAHLLPTTYVLEKNGQIIFSKTGTIEKAELEKVLLRF